MHKMTQEAAKVGELTALASSFEEKYHLQLKETAAKQGIIVNLNNELMKT